MKRNELMKWSKVASKPLVKLIPKKKRFASDAKHSGCERS
jgi:hypothetical protein